MCGIVGFHYFNPEKQVNAHLIKNMCDAIAHRGPDDEGRLWQENL